MNISYNNSPDDINAYARLLYDKSPTVSKHRGKATYTAVLIIAIISIAIYFIDTLQTLYIWLFISAAWLLYIPFQHRKRYIKNLGKQYNDDEYKNFFGRHSLSLDESGLTDKIEDGINHTGWDKIGHIELTELHTYIFIGHSMAYIIPRQSISEGDYDRFVKVLKNKVGESKEGDSDENRSEK